MRNICFILERKSFFDSQIKVLKFLMIYYLTRKLKIFVLSYSTFNPICWQPIESDSVPDHSFISTKPSDFWTKISANNGSNQVLYQHFNLTDYSFLSDKVKILDNIKCLTKTELNVQ